MSIAIVVAAGQGKRFGGATPKQFLEVAGKPILIHTLERFEECAAISRMIVVVSAEMTADFARVAARYNLRKVVEVVAGGTSRAESVRNGLQAIRVADDEIIAVHDGARPLVTADEITRTIEQARQTGAACLIAPVTDTIKKIENGVIVQTVDRTSLRRALTPQCFRRDILQRAFANIENVGEAATDESFLVEQLGINVSIVEGSARNIKITVPEDLILAEALLAQMSDVRG